MTDTPPRPNDYDLRVRECQAAERTAALTENIAKSWEVNNLIAYLSWLSTPVEGTLRDEADVERAAYVQDAIDQALGVL